MMDELRDIRREVESTTNKNASIEHITDYGTFVEVETNDVIPLEKIDNIRHETNCVIQIVDSEFDDLTRYRFR
jgi:uncharacterized protein (UPF0248 family)